MPRKLSAARRTMPMFEKTMMGEQSNRTEPIVEPAEPDRTVIHVLVFGEYHYAKSLDAGMTLCGEECLEWEIEQKQKAEHLRAAPEKVCQECRQIASTERLGVRRGLHPKRPGTKLWKPKRAKRSA